MYEESELKETFHHFDRDDNGRIDLQEFGELMRTLAGDITDEEIKIGFEEIDTNGTGTIDYQEFLVWWDER